MKRFAMLSSPLLTLLTLPTLLGCPFAPGPPDNRDYRQDMRNFVQGISAYAKARVPGFIVIPQNGPELLSLNGESAGPPATDYIAAIDGVGREDLLYGYNNDNEATPEAETEYMGAFLDLAESNGVQALVTDYCSTPAFADHSYAVNAGRGYASFAADHRILDNIPAYPAGPYAVNAANVPDLAAAKNFLYLINPELFDNKQAFLNALQATNYDLFVLDLFFNGVALTAEDVASLKTKANGGSRLVICYMSIGEAEDYRYYWQADWNQNRPSWLEAENPDWPGNFKVRYWEQGWQDIIFGNDASYLARIVNAGFDGVYLDIIDAFEYFEAKL